MTLSVLGINFVPPSQSYEATSGDVFEVVEIGCEKEDCDDEYQDAISPNTLVRVLESLGVGNDDGIRHTSSK